MGQTNKSADQRIPTHNEGDVFYEITVLNKKYPDGYLSEWHQHSRWQLIHAVEGLMIVETPKGRWTLPNGCGLIIPAEEMHMARMIGSVSLRSLYISPVALSDQKLETNAVIKLTPLLEKVIERLCDYDNQIRSQPDYIHLCKIAIFEMSSAEIYKLVLPFPTEKRLSKVCRNLMADPSSKRTIDDWSNEIGMSRRTFTRAFALQTGLSFADWRRRLRCHLALEYKQKGQTLEKIASRLGYANKQTLGQMMERMLQF